MPLVPAPLFHLAFPVRDIASTRAFYADVLGCPVGRSHELWIDFDFHGHQISAHVKPEACRPTGENDVDGDGIPVRHFGLVLAWDAWHALVERLNARNVPYRLAPKIRFRGAIGEQATFFLEDPSGNFLEFKSFRDPSRVFATAPST